MITQEELDKSHSYNLARLQNDLFRELHKYMKKNKYKLSDILCDSKFKGINIRKIYDEDSNLNLSQLVKFALAINKLPNINLK